MRRDFHLNPKPLSCWLVWRYARPRNLATGQSPAAIVRRRSASWRETSSRQFQPSAAVLRTWPVPDTKTTFVDTKKHKRSTFSCFSCAVTTAFVVARQRICIYTKYMRNSQPRAVLPPRVVTRGRSRSCFYKLSWLFSKTPLSNSNSPTQTPKHSKTQTLN